MLTPQCLSTHRQEAPQRRAPKKRRFNDRNRKYLLEVDLKVRADRLEEFVDQGLALLPAFENAGLTLVSSAWKTSSDPIDIVNYWDLGNDANVLLEAELQLPDIPEFNTFNKLIEFEVKSIVIPLAARERSPAPALRDLEYRYLRVRSQVPSENLAEFVARVEAYMSRFTRHFGWFLGDTYYGVTGNAGLMTQLWVIPPISAPAIVETLAVAPWLTLREGEQLVAAPATFEILRATPSDPNLDPRREAR